MEIKSREHGRLAGSGLVATVVGVVVASEAPDAYCVGAAVLGLLAGITLLGRNRSPKVRGILGAVMLSIAPAMCFIASMNQGLRAFYFPKQPQASGLLFPNAGLSGEANDFWMVGIMAMATAVGGTLVWSACFNAKQKSQTRLTERASLATTAVPGEDAASSPTEVGGGCVTASTGATEARNSKSG